MDKDRLTGVKTIYSHASCPDGTAAAMICAAAFASAGMRPEIRFVQYQTREQLELEPGPGQLFVDITPPLSRWREWEAFSPIVLDHHDTAREAAEGLGGVYGGPDDSGASLAYSQVMAVLCPNQVLTAMSMFEWRLFSHYAMIRDTWKEDRSEFAEGQALAHALTFHGGEDLVEEARRLKLDSESLLSLGRKLFEKAERKVSVLARGASFDSVGGLRIGYFNCTEKLISETAHELLNKHGCDVAVGFFISAEEGRDQAVVSLRSRKDGPVAVNRIAQRFGGGGHRPAAGFRLDAADLSLSGLKRKVAEALPEAVAEEA